MKQAKTPNDSWGARNACANFEMCPICYGCRNYSSKDPDCNYCIQNKKKNICDTNIHKADVVAKFISKNRVNIKGKVEFKSR